MKKIIHGVIKVENSSGMNKDWVNNCNGVTKDLFSVTATKRG